MKQVATLALAALLTSAVLAQEAELDRTDPQVVARAYVDACRAGDLETAITFLVDKREIEAAREFTEDFADEPGEMGMDMGDIFVEFQFFPIGFEIERTPGEATVEDGRAQVTFEADFTFDQQLVLRQQDDGTWAISLLESVEATRGTDKTFIGMELGVGREAEMQMAEAQAMEAAMMLDMGGQGIVPPRPNTSEEALLTLWRFAWEYANEHEGQLPAPERWADELEIFALDRSCARNPEQPDLPCGYAMNADAQGMDLRHAWDDPAVAEAFLFVEWPTGERNVAVDAAGFAETQAYRGDGEVAYITITQTVRRAPAGEPLEVIVPEMEAAMEEGLVGAGEPDADLQNAVSCQERMRLIIGAIRRFARNNGGVLPDAASWMDDLAPYVMDLGTPDAGPLWNCPADADIEFAYAFNAELSGMNALDLPDHGTVVAIFESDIDELNAAALYDPAAAPLDRHREAYDLAEGRSAGHVGYLNGAINIPGDRPEE